MVEIENLSRITAPNTIILCKEPFYAPVNATLPADAVGLLSSDNLPAAEFIRRCGVRAMTLGMSSKDTLTLSSITPDSAVLCLQRAISDLFGSTLHPVEIPFPFPTVMMLFLFSALPPFFCSAVKLTF